MFYLAILASWALFLTVWATTYSKIQPKAVIPHDENSYVGVSIIGILAVLLVFRGHIFGSSSHYYTFVRDHHLVAVGAVALCALGIAFAIWSRIQSTQKDNNVFPFNPASYVRYPMYVGVLVAMAGSALVGAIPWVLIGIATAVYLAYRVAYAEERIPKAPFAVLLQVRHMLKKQFRTFVPTRVTATNIFSFRRR